MHRRSRPSCGSSARPEPARLRSSPRSRATRAPRSGKASSPARERRRSTTCRPRRRCFGFSIPAGSERRTTIPPRTLPGARGSRTSCWSSCRWRTRFSTRCCSVLQQARRRHPEWPVVVAQTGLHRLYPAGMGHPTPIPTRAARRTRRMPPLPHALRQALAHQRRLFDGLRGPRPRFVPIDFTVPEDGFPPHDFGLEMFWRVLQEAGPSAFEALHLARADAESDRIRAKARPLIYGYGAAAAGAGAVPIPMVGVGGLAGMIAMMLRALASRYGVAWTPRHLRPIQRRRRRRCARLVGPPIRPARNAQARPDDRHRGGRSAQRGGGFRGDRRHRRGRLRMAGLPAPRSDGAQRRGAPRLCRRTCGRVAAGEESDRADAGERA